MSRAVQEPDAEFAVVEPESQKFIIVTNKRHAGSKAWAETYLHINYEEGIKDMKYIVDVSKDVVPCLLKQHKHLDTGAGRRTKMLESDSTISPILAMETSKIFVQYATYMHLSLKEKTNVKQR